MRHALAVFVLSIAAVASGADLDQVAAGLKSKDAKVRFKAVEDLGNAGKDAAPHLRQIIDAATDKNSQIGRAALVAVAKIDPDAHKTLSAMVLGGPAARIEAMREAGEMGERGALYAGVIEASLKAELQKWPVGLPMPKASKGVDPKAPSTPIFNQAVAGQAMAALAEVREFNPEMLKLAHALVGPMNPHKSMRQGAISYLVKWAGRDEDKRKAVIPALKAMIETPGEPNVVYCLRVAGGYGPAAAELLPLIEPLAASRNEGVRIAAVDAAARIRGQRKD